MNKNIKSSVLKKGSKGFMCMKAFLNCLNDDNFLSVPGHLFQSLIVKEKKDSCDFLILVTESWTFSEFLKLYSLFILTLQGKNPFRQDGAISK